MKEGFGDDEIGAAKGRRRHASARRLGAPAIGSIIKELGFMVFTSLAKVKKYVNQKG